MAQPLAKMFSVMEQYDFKFEKNNDRLKCTICDKMLINAHQTLCGCMACEKCIKNYIHNGQKQCPSGQEDCANFELKEKDVRQDNAINKEIGNFKVKCPFTLCCYRDSLKNIVKHIEACEFREITCEKCGKSVLFKEKLKHYRQECEERDFECPLCKQIITYKEHKTNHFNADSDKLCSSYETYCPYECSTKGKVNLKDHLKCCVNRKLKCPFHLIDCDKGKMDNEQLKKHIKDEFYDHFSSLISKYKCLDYEIEQTTKILESHRQIIKEISVINDKKLESRMRVGKIEEEIRNRHSQETSKPSFKTPMFRNGNFIWKITDYETKRLDAESGSRISITSDPFLTSEFGYKMCLRIYPVGDGVGKGTHLSVFFAIMKGDYDDLLSWPFKHKVTLSIFDLVTNTKHIVETFRPDSSLNCYQKPVNEMNVATGSPRLILLSQLTSSDSIYCKDDVIYVKISVDSGET